MRTILFNPFKKYSETVLLAYGIAITFLGSLSAYFFSVRFDGVLDLHFVPYLLFWQPLTDNLVNIFCLTIFLFLLSKYINRKARAIDILTVAILARTPYYLLPLFNMNNGIKTTTDSLVESIASGQFPDISITTVMLLLIFTVFSLGFLVWYMILLFNGFKVASNAKGTRPIVLFVACILLAEIVSKILIKLVL